MALKPEEVSWVIQKEIEKDESSLQMESVGTVLQIGDGIARVWGLEDVMMSELVEFPGGILGMVLNLEGDIVKRTGKIASVPVGDALAGRVVNALGQPLDGKGPIVTNKFRPMEGKA